MRRENSSTRGVPLPTRPAELTVEVIVPKLAGTVRVLASDFVVTVSEEDGWPYWARLKILNASARKITLSRSVIRKVFSIAESSCHSGGPVRRLRPALPQVPTAGNENAAALIHCEMLRLPRYSGIPGTRLGLWFTLFPSGSRYYRGSVSHWLAIPRERSIGCLQTSLRQADRCRCRHPGTCARGQRVVRRPR